MARLARRPPRRGGCARAGADDHARDDAPRSRRAGVRAVHALEASDLAAARAALRGSALPLAAEWRQLLSECGAGHPPHERLFEHARARAAEESAASVRGVHTIVLQVSDLPRSIGFYESALGVAFVRRSERAAGARVGASELLLHAQYEPLPERRGAGVHVNFSVADARAHHARLREQGLTPGPVSSKPWGSQFELTDPDGYGIEFLGPAA